ncbi:MAG: GNAT family N-acetyltransferase [Firmicutes bacterium]|nr:GNAT family N-acetyltransferase [Bacillota bacterium]
MTLKFLVNPEVDAGELSKLRKTVGWDERRHKLEKIIGCTYLSVACFDERRMVGYVDVLSDGVDDALIRGLMVDPEYQKQGIALELINMVTAAIRKDRIKTVNVLFEPELEPLYRKAGFRIVCGGLIDNEDDHQRD